MIGEGYPAVVGTIIAVRTLIFDSFESAILAVIIGAVVYHKSCGE